MNGKKTSIFVLLAASAPYLSGADRPVCEIWPTPGCEPAMAQNVRHAIESFGQAVAEKAAFNAKIAVSRQRMAAGCSSSRLLRDHPAQIPEANNFFALLDAKDIYFFSLTYDPIGFGPQYQAFNEMIEKSTGFGKKLDNGIRPMAIFPWTDWIDSMNRQAKRNGSTTLNGLLENYSALFTFNKTSGYLRYRLARNLVELNACGCNLTSSPEELWMALLTVRRPWYNTGAGDDSDPAGTARNYYQKLNEVYGAESMERAVKSLLDAHKDSDGAILSPAGGKEDSFTAVGRFLGDTGSRSYLLNVLLGWRNPFRPDQVAEAGLHYRELAAAYGAAAVNQAAQSLGRAKLDEFGRIADPQALGIGPAALKNALFDVLATQHPAGYARAMLAFHDQLTDPAAIESAYDKLTAAYKPGDVLAASHDLLKLWQAPISLLPSRYVSVVQERFTREKDPGFDFGMFMKLLNKTERLPTLDGPSAEIVTDPRYLAWAKFKPGDSAVYAFKTWMEKDGQVVTGPRRPPSPADAPYRGILAVSLLKSIDPQTAVVEFFDKNLAGAGTAKPLEYSYAARINKEHLQSPDQPTLVSRTSGSDTLEVNGRTYACVWEKAAYRFPTGSKVITTWKSDAVPGGLVLEREEQGSSEGVSLNEKVLQPFPITDPGMLRSGLPVAFAVTSSQNPSSSQETAKLAERGPADLVKTGDGKLPPIPFGTMLKVVTDDAIDAAEIDAGGAMTGTLAENVVSGTDILYLKGTKVQLKAQKAYGGLIAITGEEIWRDGQSLPIHTSTFNTGLRVPAATANPQTAPSRPAQTPSVRIGGFSIPRISLPGGRTGPPSPRPAQPVGVIPEGTSILLLIKG